MNEKTVEGLRLNGKCGSCGQANELVLTTWYRCVDVRSSTYHVKVLPTACTACGEVIDIIELDRDLDLYWRWFETIKIDRL